jgi:hypothetical protein
MKKPPLGMIVTASGQMMPNVLGFLHFRSRLRRLRIYSTEKMFENAKRFKQWCLVLEPGLDVSIEPHSFSKANKSTEPENVKSQIILWIENENGAQDLDWVVNASGGNKMMAFGLLPAIWNPRTKVIYADIDTGWWEIYFNANNKRIDSNSFAISSTLIDDIPLDSLASLHTGDVWSIAKCDPALVTKLLPVTRSLLQNQWEWKEAFVEHGITPGHDVGTTFELYIAALCTKLGAARVAMNACPRIGNNAVAENDVVVLHNNSVFLLDCKTTDDQGGFATEIYDARQRANDMGGLGARAVLIRPRRFEIKEAYTGLAKPNAVIWGGELCGNIIANLAKMFNIPENEWPADLIDIEAIFEKERKQLRPIFIVPRDWKVMHSKPQSDDQPMALLNVKRVLIHQAALTGHPRWSGYHYDKMATLFFQCSPDRKMASKIKEIFTEYCHRPQVRFSPSEGKVNTVTVNLSPVITILALSKDLASGKLLAALDREIEIAEKTGKSKNMK